MIADKTILLTGATGFVGRSVALTLVPDRFVFLSRKDPDLPNGVYCKADISVGSDYSTYLKDVDVVIHCAAKVDAPKKVLFDVNIEGTLNLARQAAESGVKRFIFISSVKVCGEGGAAHNVKYDENMKSAPEDDYGQSKYEAEEVLKKISVETGMELVIIRPPLVYGSGVKANFLSLMTLASKKIPLPFGLIHNQRSMVYIENLADFIIHCIDHPKAANETFLISDGDDVSLSRLIKLMRSSMGRSPRLLPVPIWLFKSLGLLAGKKGVIDRLVGDLQVDSSKARELLGWEPPFTVEEGIELTVKSFLESKK